jgi:hypothetical protein
MCPLKFPNKLLDKRRWIQNTFEGPLNPNEGTHLKILMKKQINFQHFLCSIHSLGILDTVRWFFKLDLIDSGLDRVLVAAWLLETLHGHIPRSSKLEPCCRLLEQGFSHSQGRLDYCR